MTAARDILQRLSALGARIERRGERLVICTGRRPVPSYLIAAARSVKPDLVATLSAATEDAQHEEGERLRYTTKQNPRISAASVEDAQVTGFDERLRAKPSKVLREDAHVSAFVRPEDFCGSQPALASKMLTSPSLSTFGENERLRREWGEAEEERAAIVEHDGNIPRAWAEGFARLDPDRRPATCRRGAGCGSSTTLAGFSIARFALSPQHSVGDRSTCSGAIGSGLSPASVRPGFCGS